MDRQSRRAVHALEAGLAQSPRFAPSLEQVRECIAGAIALICAQGFSPPPLIPPYERRPGLSLRDALAESSTHPAACVHAEKFLDRLIDAGTLPQWQQNRTKGQALTLLRKALRLLTPHRRRGPVVTSGVDASGVLRIRRQLAARAVRLTPEPEQLCFPWR